MISVKNLYHSYEKNDAYAVKDVSFEVEKGEVFGFLGPSGAGKSTTQGILTGLLPLQKGEATVAGCDMHKPQRSMFNKIGVSFEQSNVYGKLTALENLKFYQKLFDVKTEDPMKLLEIAGLDHVANKKAGEFSKGMKHRLTFVRSMLNNPELWFLDEPTTGLDPAIASKIKDIIKEQNSKGTTVFLTTHNMFVADELCHRVAFIIDGVIKLIDSPRNLKLKYGEKMVAVDHVEEGKTVKEQLSLLLPEDKERLSHIIKNGKIEMMHTKEATLEEIFIKVTGRGLK
ncbi:ABC transporter ATP-binding protein [Alkalibacter saccharofermentans]|uniref:Fluoroquinolone transport system ATP-binding protein n=1 Tax=Alkalibacter saccharofermentans DSM 14828 TaxID=1120975 RepID=A0A1M4SJ76_9FIRM|nr:ABC transporter ATP-binding protein [Alkalibacter saccharofermentans]SHE32202.1 fluoroquinolone transport system ATP-binding protein [Alkalibacter saccharofermentans DSM 14828]